MDVDVLDFQFDFLYFGYSFGHISNNWAIFFNLLVMQLGASWRHMAHQGVTGQSGASWGAPGRYGVLHASRGAPCVKGYSASRGILGRHGVLGASRGARGVTGCLGV